MPDARAVDDEAITEDALLGGRVRLLQPARGHRAGTDAVLLAAEAAASLAAGARAADVGAATGAVGLMLAARMKVGHLLFVERDPWLADLCRRNLALNGLDARSEVRVADILAFAEARRAAGLTPGSVDLVATNPPFLDPTGGRRSPDARRAAAHELPTGGLSAWLEACTDLLAPKGRLVLIHRADRVRDCLLAMPRGLGDLTLRFVHPKADAAASRVLISGRQGSRAPLAVAPSLVLHASDGGFTPEAQTLHAGQTTSGG